jgi:hypothetical protein
MSTPYSVPDDRNYGNFPNDAVDVNGTETYTVPSVDSRAAGAPVDSRAAGAPVASAAYPQNSRTPGLYGPGENSGDHMSATSGTLLGVFSGATFAAAFTNPAGLDVLQIVNEGGSVVYSIDSTGTAHTNPTSPTSESLMWRLQGSSISNAFQNDPSQLDLFQIYSPVGGALVYYVDFTGTTH